MRALAAASALVLLVAVPVRAASETCEVPGSLTENFSRLPHVAQAVMRDKKLEVLVLSGVPSQAGAASKLKNYPAYLEQILRGRLKDIEVNVYAHAEPRKSISEIIAALPKLLEERKPNLVIWQTGTIEAMRGMDPDSYGDKLLSGVDFILKSNADVILLNQQYSPRTDFMFDGGPYTDNMRWVSQTKDIPLFNRYAVMKYWSDTGIFDFTALRNDDSFEKLHRCLGGLLSDLIIRAASLPGSVDR